MAEKDTLLSKTASFYDEKPETDDVLSVFPISHSKLISKKSEIKHTSPFSFSVRKSLPYLLVHKEKTFQQKLFALIDEKRYPISKHINVLTFQRKFFPISVTTSIINPIRKLPLPSASV